MLGLAELSHGLAWWLVNCWIWVSSMLWFSINIKNDIGLRLLFLAFLTLFFLLVLSLLDFLFLLDLVLKAEVNLWTIWVRALFELSSNSDFVLWLVELEHWFTFIGEKALNKWWDSILTSNNTCVLSNCTQTCKSKCCLFLNQSIDEEVVSTSWLNFVVTEAVE